MESLQYFLHQQIDKEKWDNCINKSANGLIYAKSFYLDTMAANWDTIVLNDYEAVMPLTWKKKWGIIYLYQPAFIQQGGIFYTATISPQTANAFVKKAFDKFKFAEVTFNYLNDTIALENCSIATRNNYVLPLTNSYNDIAALYHSSIIKDLKRSKRFDVTLESSADYTTVLKLYESLYKERLEKWVDEDMGNFSIVCKKLLQENNLVVRTVNNKSGEILAAVILLKDNNRLYNIISCITAEGRRMGINHILYDELIREFSNSNYCLDFEGSDIKGVAEFYSRFPVVNETYPFVKWNKLPWLAKIFKK